MTPTFDEAEEIHLEQKMEEAIERRHEKDEVF